MKHSLGHRARRAKPISERAAYPLWARQSTPTQEQEITQRMRRGAW